MDRKALAEIAGVLFSAPTLEQARFKIAILSEFLAKNSAGKFVPWRTIEEIVAELGVGLDEDEIRTILSNMPVWERVDDQIRVRANVDLRVGTDGFGRDQHEQVKVEALLEEFKRSQDDRLTSPSLMIEVLGDVIVHFLRIVQKANRANNGFPSTFWSSIGGQDALEPAGPHPSAITLLDILNCIYELSEMGGPPILAKSDIIKYSTELYLALDHCVDVTFAPSNSYPGLLYIDGDDDFVELNLKPNVPTNAHFLRALFAEHRWRVGSGAPVRPNLTSVARPVIEFLLETQQEDGLWGTYRYNTRTVVEAPTDAYFSVLAIRSLVAASADATQNNLDRVTKAIERAATKLGRCALSSAREIQSVTLNGAVPPNQLVDVFEASFGAILGVCQMSDSSSVATAELRQLLGSVTLECAEGWAKSMSKADEPHVIRVYPPGQNGYLRPNTWEQPAEAKTVYYLLNLKEDLDLRFSSQVNQAIDRAAENIVLLRDGPLWKDFKLKHLAFPSNSTVFCLALAKWRASLAGQAARIVEDRQTGYLRV